MDQQPNNFNQPATNQGAPSSQFDYSGLTAPESMGGGGGGMSPAPAPTPPPQAPAANDELVFPGSGTQGAPANVPTPGAGKSWFYIIILVILLILAILVFLSWKGWVSLGPLDSIWGGGKPTPTPDLIVSESPSPVLSDDATRKKDLATLQLALKKYYADAGSYPASPTAVKTSDATSVLAQALVPSYLPSLPDDPGAPTRYYNYTSSGTSFSLSAALDDKTDPSGVLSGNFNIYTLTDNTGA